MQLGTVLKRRWDGWRGLFWNHLGVYVGGGNVIHVYGEKGQRPFIRIDTVEAFGRGRTVRVHCRPPTVGHGRAACATAEQLLEDYQRGLPYFGTYDMFLDQCLKFDH